MLLIDAHVHLYRFFDLEAMLMAALRNFRQQAKQRHSEAPHTGILLLTETSGEDGFRRLLQLCRPQAMGGLADRTGWSFHATVDGSAVRIKSADNWRLWVIAGRQIVSAENIEVLSLLSSYRFENGLPAQALIDAIHGQSGLPVLPWGAGKWMGKRGEIVSGIVRSGQRPVFLGDNGGRPGIWPRGRLFSEAQAREIKILPGTDPLPLKWEQQRPGSFGFAVAGDLDSRCPAQSLRKLILNPETRLEAFGRPATLWSFIKNQIAIRVKKRSE